MLLVLRCPGCGKSKVAREGVKRTVCAHCGKSIETARAVVVLATPDEAEARLAAGSANAQRAGRPEEFRAAFAGQAAPRAPPSDAQAAAVRAAASARGDEARLEAAARAFAAASGAFAPEAFAPVLAALGIAGPARDRLERLAASGVLYEPRPGRFALA
ncbi:MAG TPA: hypothetical protein VM889_08620 [Candidatus Thermoplasmatota archaeon]|nr:hypothetical protein [Candidatus Thermoplasmatota archaeon]